MAVVFSKAQARTLLPLFIVGGAALFLLVGGCGKKEEAAPADSSPKAAASAGMPTPDPQGNIPGISKAKDDPVGPK